MNADEKKPDLAALQDRIVEMAKDLLMLDTGAVLEHLRVTCPPGKRTDKEIAFEGLAAALHGARTMAEEFRAAHIEAQKKDLRDAMESQVQEQMARIDKAEVSGLNPVLGRALEPEDITSRRAS